MKQMMDEDERDLADARNGVPEAFARLYDRYAAVVFSLCRRLSISDHEDAAQETFIRAFRKLDQLDQPSSFRAWLFTIAANVCAEKRRAAARRKRHEGEAMNHNGSIHGLLPATHDVESFEAKAQLTAALDRLSDRERLAIHLYYLDADPVSCAMPVLEVSRSGYYKLLARARERLAHLMSRNDAESLARKERSL